MEEYNLYGTDMSQTEGSVPFSFFTSLITAISTIQHVKAGYKGPTPYYALDKFKAWRQHFLTHFPEPPPHTTRIVFCLVFPELDYYRKYHLQEAKLAQAVAQALSLSHSRLVTWKEAGSTGCLGREIRKALEHKSSNLDEASRLSVDEVNDLLDELASLSPNSDASIHTKYPRDIRRSRHEILSVLFRRLNPTDAGVLAQIILKDLIPLLYPVKLTGYGSELRAYNTKSVKHLLVQDAMDVWDPSGRLRRLHRTHANLRYATEAFERNEEEFKPHVGVMIPIIHSIKLQGVKNAFNTFAARSSRVWVETKYDGERAQIHVQIMSDGTSHITIYSKSGRNSTLDRIAVHWIVRQALGLPDPENGYEGRPDCRVTKSVILDAEMVAWDTDHVDEFWRIRSLVERTARGVRRRARPAKAKTLHQDLHDGYSQSSLMSDCDEDTCEEAHLSLVFFDIMVLNDESLLGRPYAHRRALLESVVQPISNYCMFSERYPVDIPRTSQSQQDSDTEDDEPSDKVSSPPSTHAQRARTQLYRIFAQHLVQRREGVVIKAEESFYNDYCRQWGKLKRDYIPGYGDTLDLALIGAAWDKERARTLGVSPSAYTTFYIGALTNAEDRKKNPSIKPNYHVYFVSSYGLSRRQLEDMTSRINARSTVLFSDLRMTNPKNTPIGHPELEYTLRLYDGLAKPHIVFCEPMLAEVYGAGFDVSRGSKHYELRFPRISKIHNIEDRPHTACSTIQELNDLAYAVVGRQSTQDEVDALWHRMTEDPHDGASGKRKRGPDEDEWVELLRAADEGRLKPEERKKRVRESFERSSGSDDPGKSTSISASARNPRNPMALLPVQGSESRIAPASVIARSAITRRRAVIHNTAPLPTPSASPVRPAPEIIDLCSPPSSPKLSSSPLMPEAPASPFIQFLQQAGVIYYDLPRGRNHPRSPFDSVIKDALGASSSWVSPDLRDFMFRCGWVSERSLLCAFGVVISDVGGGAAVEAADGRLKIVHQIRQARKSLNEKGAAPGRARLWVFDIDMLLYTGQDFLSKHLAEF